MPVIHRLLATTLSSARQYDMFPAESAKLVPCARAFSLRASGKPVVLLLNEVGEVVIASSMRHHVTNTRSITAVFLPIRWRRISVLC